MDCTGQMTLNTRLRKNVIKQYRSLAMSLNLHISVLTACYTAMSETGFSKGLHAFGLWLIATITM